MRERPFAAALLAFSLYGAAAASAAPPAPGMAAPTPIPLPSALPSAPSVLQTTPPLETAAPQASGTPAASAAPVSSAVPTPSPTPYQSRAFSVRAHKVAWYSNRYILTAQGDVDVKLADGAHLTGQRFAYDVRLNRFVLAGGVTFSAAGQTWQGAAFADYFDFDRQYFVPSAPEPDRWTYAASDYAHPLRGREMPGDTFYLPDVSREPVFAYASNVVIQPHESIRFVNPRIKLGLVYVPFPSYFLNYGPNPNYAQNSLPGAYVDGPLDLWGGGHSLFSAHLRYDPTDNVFLAYEEHQYGDNYYLVGSISPVDKVFKHYNLEGYDRVTPGFAVQTSLQENAFQQDFKQPLSATAFANLLLTATLPRSYVQWQSHSYYDSLLDQPPPGIDGLLYYGDPTHNWVPDHPDDAMVTWQGYQNRVGRTPFYLTLRSGFGFAHDGLDPPQDFGNVAYRTIYNHTIGVNLAVPSYKLVRDRSGRGGDLYFNASVDKQREWFSVPHHVDTTITSLSLSRQFDPHLIGVVGYQTINTGDYYGALQNLAYPSNQKYTDPITGAVVPSWSAFRGFGTQRFWVEQLVYTPTTYVAANLSFRQDRDFPQPLAGFTYQDNIGNEPFQATLDMRFRVSPTISLDVSRSYYFNFGGLDRWSPAFTFQVLR